MEKTIIYENLIKDDFQLIQNKIMIGTVFADRIERKEKYKTLNFIRENKNSMLIKEESIEKLDLKERIIYLK